MEKNHIPTNNPTSVLELLPPFPVVLVTTKTNIISVSQMMYFTFAPLRLGIAIAHARHTYSLLKTEGEFVINIPGPDLLEAVRICGAVSGRNIDKFEAAHLNREPSSIVAAPSIAQCGAHIECRIEREMEFGDRTWFIGPVVGARKKDVHQGMQAMHCDRHNYSLPGVILGSR